MIIVGSRAWTGSVHMIKVMWSLYQCPPYGRDVVSFCYNVSATSVDHPGWPEVVSSEMFAQRHTCILLCLVTSKEVVVAFGRTQWVATFNPVQFLFSANHYGIPQTRFTFGHAPPNSKRFPGFWFVKQFPKNCTHLDLPLIELNSNLVDKLLIGLNRLQ